MAATLKAKATLDDKPFQTALTRMRSKSKQAAASIKSDFGSAQKLGIAAAAAGAAYGFGRLTTKAIDNAAALAKVSRTTGIAVRDLAILQDTFEENQADLGTLTTTLVMMEKALANMKADDAAASLADLGISAQEFLAASPSEKFQQLSKAISALHDPLQRQGAAMKFFGRSGKELLPIMDDIAKLDLSAANEEAEALQKMSEEAREAKRAMTQAKDAAERLGVGIASTLLPRVTKAIKAFSEWGGVIQTVGESLGAMAQGDFRSAEERQGKGATEIAPMVSTGHDPWAKFTTAHSRRNDFLDYAFMKQHGLVDPNVSTPRSNLQGASMAGTSFASALAGAGGGLQGGSLLGIGGSQMGAHSFIRRGDQQRAKERERLKKQEEYNKRTAEATERIAQTVEQVANQ